MQFEKRRNEKMKNTSTNNSSNSTYHAIEISMLQHIVHITLSHSDILRDIYQDLI